MTKKAFEISLNTIVELVLAVMGIFAVTIIVLTVISVFYSSGEDERYQIQGFKALYTKISENERRDVQEPEFGLNTYLTEDFVIVAFSKNEESIEGECNYGSVIGSARRGLADLPFADHVRRVPFLSDDITELSVDRPDTCRNDYPCLCLCRQEFTDGKISCHGTSYCIPFREEHTKDISFEAYVSDDIYCEIPLVYAPERGSITDYCVRRNDDGSLTFVPEIC